MQLAVCVEAGSNSEQLRREGAVLVQRDESRNYTAPSFDVSPNNLSKTVFLFVSFFFLFFFSDFLYSTVTQLD